jgi:hypothetical protein
MWDERVLVAGAVVILVGFLVAAMVVPGAIAAPDQDQDRPVKLNLRDMAIVSGEISGDTAELIVQTRLSHAGPTAENVTIELRATSLDSGLLEATTRMSIAQIKGDREVTVNGTLPVGAAGRLPDRGDPVQRGATVGDGRPTGQGCRSTDSGVRDIRGRVP